MYRAVTGLFLLSVNSHPERVKKCIDIMCNKEVTGAY